jgi:hypothetical protein
MNLKKYQEHFQSFILKNKNDIEKNILPAKNLSPSEQMGIYQNSYYERIIAAMMQDFPTILGHLGEDAFASMVRDYIDCYPSTDFNLKYIGKNLAAFLLEKDKSLLPFSELAQSEYDVCAHTDV